MAIAALGILGGGISYSIIGARLKGPPKPHAVVTGRFFPSGNPQQRDFFFSNIDPVKRMLDVLYLGPLEKSGEEVPLRVQGRDVFPYISVTAWNVSWEGLGSFRTHIWVLPDPWNSFFGHHHRLMGAYVLGEQIDHGNSDCITVYVAPFLHKFLDEEMPIYYGVEGTSTFVKVTKTWQPTMRFIASMDMERVIREYAAELWPTKQIDEIVDKVLVDKKQEVAAMIARSKRENGGGN